MKGCRININNNMGHALQTRASWWVSMEQLNHALGLQVCAHFTLIFFKP